MRSFTSIEFDVMQWADKRDIYRYGKPESQLFKAVSEMGELCDAHNKDRIDEIKDAVGDILVCLVNYCVLKDISMLECFDGAYKQIKDRKGKTLPNGTFVKEDS